MRQAEAQGDRMRAWQLLKLVPPNPESQLWGAVLLLHDGKMFASIRSLEELTRFNDSATLEILLAVDYFLLNQRRLAEQALDRAVKFDPADLRIFYFRGRLHFVLHDFAQAGKEFGEVLAKRPNDYRSLYYCGFGEWRLGEISAARRDLLQAIEVLTCNHADFFFVPLALSDLELRTGQTAAALDHINLALKMVGHVENRGENSDQVADVLFLRGKIHFARGDRRAAEADWRQAVRLNPNLDRGWYWVARLYRWRGETTHAVEAQVRNLHGRG